MFLKLRVLFAQGSLQFHLALGLAITEAILPSGLPPPIHSMLSHYLSWKDLTSDFIFPCILHQLVFSCLELTVFTINMEDLCWKDGQCQLHQGLNPQSRSTLGSKVERVELFALSNN